jgi:hypothetical protein
VAAAGSGQRARRVGRDELDEDALGGLGRAGAEAVAALQDVRERGGVPPVGQEEVQEPGAGDLDAIEPVAQPTGLATARGGAPTTGASSMAAFVA